MKRAAAFAALVALLAWPAMAQRGGARGGSSGHASGGFAGHAGGFAAHGFGGGFAGPRMGGFAPRGTGFAPRFGGYAPRGFAPRGFMGSARAAFAPRYGPGINRAPYRGDAYGQDRRGNRYGGDHRRHRMPYNGAFNGINYGYDYGTWPGYGFVIDPGFLGPDWLDYDDDSGDNSNASTQDYYGGNAPAPYPDYGEPGPDYGEPAPGPDGYGNYAPRPYPDSAPEGYPAQSSQSVSPRQPYTGSAAPGPQQAVKLIFNNGRPPETIQNYMLTANTLTVLDSKYQQIPVSQIDLPATVAANRAEGVNFQVPHAAN